MRGGWTLARAEAHLRSLELFGMRFGLDRIRRLLTALGSPQRQFEAIHVVGSNGKSSTTRLAAQLLSSHGLLVGAYLSPHLRSYTERVLIGGRPIDPEGLAAAIERAAHASAQVNRTLAGEDHVTQFELLTAASFYALARAGVEVVVVEAGLGGRYDATNVLDAPVCVLTNVSLEHTRWLGPTVRAIAGEKLAVVGERARLVLGPQPQPEVLELARELEWQRGVAVEVVDLAEAQGPGWRALPLFQRANLATAVLAARRMLERLGRSLDPCALERLLTGCAVEGRFQVVGDDPLTVFDGAHNPAAAEALALAWRERHGQLPIALVLGVLEDKDAVGMLEALLGLCKRAWFTAPPGPRALPAATLHSLASQLGFADGEVEPNPQRALAAASRWAVAQQQPTAVVVTGSIYLLGELAGELAGGVGERGRDAAR